jgi:seipin
MADTHQDVLQTSYRAATSRKAQRTLLGTALLVSTSAVLFGFAAFAYLLFYRNHLPDQVTRVPIHLQYGYGINPYGIASFAKQNLKEQQNYDIVVSLSLPRSPANLDRGNFMVALHLLSGAAPRPGAPLPGLTGIGISPPTLGDPNVQAFFQERSVVYSTARPAIIPYTDPLISLARRLLFVAYHMLRPGADRVRITLPLAERVRFPRSGGLPTSLYLELQAGQTLQVYEVDVTLTAQLSGLRWFMYHYRILAFLSLTAAFWFCEVCFTFSTWLALSYYMGGGASPLPAPAKGLPDSSRKAIKAEEVLSDTPRTFPTQSNQPPLRYEPAVKTEDEAESSEVLPARGAVADDEDEGDAGQWRDSGIGTSYSDAGTATLVRKRSSHHGR